MRIVLCFPVEPQQVEQIQATVPDWEVVDAGQRRIAEELPNADIFCGHAKVPVPWPKVVQLGRLQWIQSSAAGLDHCLTPEVIDSPIPVTSAAGLFANQVAEQTMTLILGLTRSMPTFFVAAQRKEFIRRPTGDLHGKTIGIIGLGGNGRRIAEVLAPWNVRILATDVFPTQKPNHVEQLLPADQLPEILPQCDIVILCVPLNSQTTGMIDAKVFAQMKSDAMFINVARGPVVNELDLIAALQQGQIGAAGLDVTEVEPLAESSPLWAFPNVLITPHVGAQSARRVPDTVDFFCENLKHFRAGEPLLNLVDKILGFPPPENRAKW
ncbi:MAG: phosphoglycerate dehydrogenase-like enzyme [Pirellulaceae bacterium]|jgi:phosphoglycerate dehydrogenase-like enzyme